MGLQSNGKGGYTDESGQVVARTVNGELVFYDGQGGAVTDGAGGKDMVMSQPSWVDPDTGLIMVPPAQPETPEELAATPDPLPATPPMGFDLFVKQKHKQVKADLQAQREADADIASQEQELDEFYKSNQGSGLFYEKAKGVIDVALKSGDESKEQTAALMKQFLEDDAEEIMKYFEAVGEGGQTDLAVAALKTFVNRAKSEAAMVAYQDIEDPVERYMAMEKDGVDLTGEGPSRLEDLIPVVLGHVEPKPNPPLEGKKLTVKGKETKWEIHNDGKVKEGDLKRLGGASLPMFDDLDTALNNHYEPGNYLDVTWGVDDKDRDLDDKRMAALDAMKTWKRGILPNLPVGSVVSATPDVFRGGLESLYKKAGFGSQGGSQTLNGVVMISKSGKKVMVPLSDEGEDFKLEQKYLDQLAEDISTDRELFIAELCFDDYV